MTKALPTRPIDASEPAVAGAGAGPPAAYAVELSPAQVTRLEELATALGVAPTNLIRLAVEDFLNDRDMAFQRDVDFILDENAELYRRLA